MYTDKPIASRTEDVYNRISFSQMIGDLILSTQLGESICIGLTGPWGSGKTSIINMAEEYIGSEERNPRIDIMRFEPWNFATTEQLTSQFFFQLAELFGVDNTNKKPIGRAISDYARGMETSFIASLISTATPFAGLLSSIIKTSIDKVGETVSREAFQNKSIQTQKNKLQQLLEESEEKILIVIDDIDRLTDEQIRCVFQLVTVVCKFPNINYLLSFDREIVTKALDKLQDGKGNEFLKKVIQVPITLPIIPRNRLFSVMADSLNVLLNEYQIQNVDERKWRELYNYCVAYLIRTHRDILRLCNGIKTKMTLISGDIDFEDLLILTIIEQHEPKLYQWIQRHKDRLTGQLTYECLYDHDDTVQAKRARKERYKNEIDELLCHKNQFTTDLALETLCIVFPAFSSLTGGFQPSYHEERLRRRNSAGHPLKIDRYFTYNVDSNQVTHTDLMFVLNEATEEEICEKIILMDKEDASIELCREIKAHCNLIEKGRLEILIKSFARVGEILKTESSDGLFTRFAPDEVVLLISDLMMLMTTEERFDILKIIIIDMNDNSLDLVSAVMHRISYAHRNAEERPSYYDKYPTLKSEEELIILEKEYLKRVSEIRDDQDKTEMFEKRHFIQYYKQFPEGKEFISKVIAADPKITIYYLYTTMGLLHPVGGKDISSIEIREDYADLVDKETVLNAIRNAIATGDIIHIGKEQQRAAVAFLMKHEEPIEYPGTIQVEEVDKRIKMLITAGQ